MSSNQKKKKHPTTKRNSAAVRNFNPAFEHIQALRKYEYFLVREATEVELTGKITSAGDAIRFIGKSLSYSPIECMYVIHVDTKKQVIGIEKHTQGLQDCSLARPRELFLSALLSGAAAIIILHNHPSGDLQPSWNDEALAARMREAGELLGVPLLDFLIVADENRFVRIGANCQRPDAGIRIPKVELGNLEALSGRKSSIKGK